MAKRRKKKAPVGDLSNLEYGKRLHAEGVARRQKRERDKAIAAAKVLLGRKIYL